MAEKRDLEQLSVEELERLLYQKKRAQRQDRLARMKNEGRLVEVAGLPPPNPDPPPLIRPKISAAGGIRQHIDGAGETGWGFHDTPDEKEKKKPRRGLQWRWLANKALLLVEIGAVVAFIFLIFSFLETRQELNQELAALQQSEVAAFDLPQPTATPLINVVVLPSGHKPPVAGRAPEPGEAGYIPDHLLPVLNEYVPPPIPTPGPQHVCRIQIPAINVDSTIVQGDDWDQLKKGVGQHIGTAQPGQDGNLVLSAHNDIYGEIFRHLDKLAPGDEIIITTERQSFTYIVREINVVEPTDVDVMAPTDHASATLISCYPYLVNDKRIVIFADLADDLTS